MEIEHSDSQLPSGPNHMHVMSVENIVPETLHRLLGCSMLNKLRSVFHVSVLLVITKFVITLSKWLWIHNTIAEWIRRLL